MEKRCDCGKIYSRGMRKVHFKFRGRVVCMEASGLVCDECYIGEFVRDFEKYAEGYVAIEDGQVVINWDKFLSLNKWGSRCNNILLLLTDLGKLSSQREGNWSVDVGRSNANPKIMNCRPKLYFVDGRDAREYAFHAFSNRGGYEIYRT